MTLSNDASSLESPDILPAGQLTPARIPWRMVGGRGIAAHLWRRFKNLVKQPFYYLYLRRLRAKAQHWNHPRHLGVIMDGNRRYARESGLHDTLQGHHAGAEKVKEVLDWCYHLGIPVVTVWSFSVDNFQRSTREVEGLLRLFEDKTREMAASRQVHEHRVRIRYIGRLEMLPESLRQEIRRIEEMTAHYTQLQLNIAMAYGGREEITDAFKRYIAERVERGEKIDDILETFSDVSIEPYLYTSGQPEPDLILRTSGEVRLSGFLLWQSAHSEFYFCETNWPAFREIDFLRALRSYDERQRRYGR